jgi:hypothetical protein
MQCAAGGATTEDSKLEPKVGGLYHIPRRLKGATNSITALVLQAKKGTSEDEAGDGSMTTTVKVKSGSKRLLVYAAPAGQSPAKRNNKGNLEIPHECLHTYCL